MNVQSTSEIPISHLIFITFIMIAPWIIFFIFRLFDKGGGKVQCGQDEPCLSLSFSYTRESDTRDPELIHEIPFPVLAEIASKYGIQPGTRHYFPAGHPSGLGGMRIYFPKGNSLDRSLPNPSA